MKIANPNINTIKSIYLFFLLSDLLCLRAIERVNIDGTHIPTKIPSSLFPVNHRVTEKRKDKNAKMMG